jgi:methylmalonyl-CoA/ethylmalonyl-CoA epimerase
MIEALDHVGIAVANIEDAKAMYRSLFGDITFHEEIVESQHVHVASFSINGVRIELTAAINEHSPIAQFIEKRGEGLHHIAFRSTGLENDLADVSQKGFTLINNIPVPGAHNMHVAFLHPKSTGKVLIELCAPKS